MQKKLEQIKQLGVYALQLSYGEYIGNDDVKTPENERKLLVIFVPMGYIGKVKCYFRGTIEEFMNFDFSQKPFPTPFIEEILDSKQYIVCGDSSELSKIESLTSLFVNKPV